MDTAVYPFRYLHCSNSGWRSFLEEDQNTLEGRVMEVRCAESKWDVYGSIFFLNAQNGSWSMVFINLGFRCSCFSVKRLSSVSKWTIPLLGSLSQVRSDIHDAGHSMYCRPKRLIPLACSKTSIRHEGLAEYNLEPGRLGLRCQGWVQVRKIVQTLDARDR